MPTYEYQCKKCKHEFEEFQSITAPPIEKCPQCSGKVVRLVSGGAGFLFKGSGFYETDYRSSDYKKKASEEKKSSEPKSSDKKESSSGEAKSSNASTNTSDSGTSKKSSSS